ncbi:hypothetical protein [Bacillus alveayuensis]|uniref:hypothetical protein n=1 Tax=Aeribacillus alveayuensis TaxID=279215 RepID=UPI0005D0F223|nr:hypothetical protein [Bacillus alveayuensis]
MSEKLSIIFEKGYSFVAFLTMLIGFVVSLLFFLSFVIGGTLGNSMAIVAGNIMSFGIRLAAIAMVLGILQVYISKKHTLSLSEETNVKDMIAELDDNTKIGES